MAINNTLKNVDKPPMATKDDLGEAQQSRAIYSLSPCNDSHTLIDSVVKIEYTGLSMELAPVAFCELDYS